MNDTSADPTKQTTDLAGDNIAQKRLIAEALRMAYEPPHPESGATTQGWTAAAHLVMFWLKHPDRVPKPPPPPLRGLVFIENDGTIRSVTSRDI